MSAFATYPSLKDKTVFVTGGASGIGAAFVQAFHDQGAKVGFVDLDEAAGQALLAKLGGGWFARCDVTDAAALEGAIADCAKALGPIGALINNVANDTRKPAIDTTIEAWRHGLAVNLDPVFIASRAVYPMMKAAGGGAIINISSINAMTKTLAREWGPDNVRMNVISPGWVVTPRQLQLWLTPQAEADWMKLVDLQRRILPEDIARLALFLAADDSGVITGQNLVIDGGRT